MRDKSYRSIAHSRIELITIPHSNTGSSKERMKSLNSILLSACLLVTAADLCAATPDRTILGVRLGARFVLPPCAPAEVTIASRLCFNAAMIDRKPWGAEQYFVSIPTDRMPPYARGELTVHVVEGQVESVIIGTWGIQGQGAALADLKKQYGEPTRSRQQLKHRLRSRFPSEFAEWDLGDMSVKLEGTTGSIDWGRIEMATSRYRKLIADYEARTPAAK